MEKYNHKKIEAKWQEIWAREPKFYAAQDDSNKPKFYCLDMFPYPSGAGLHAGHVESYTATDIMSRHMRLKGKNVLHPQGWDAFGLPAENYSIKTKIHPAKTTRQAVATFKKQMNLMGFSYDWSREVNSSQPEYYKWTQWFFLLLYKNGLAYKKKAKVNWCASCQTVLANEQAEGGVCERCGSQVAQKDMEQWFFKITDFIENKEIIPLTPLYQVGVTSGLLSGLDKVDWPESTKAAQKNWIGKSEGAIVMFKVKSLKLKVKEELEIFTTRLDTIFGCTYLVVAPEHPLVENYKLQITNYKEVEEYIIKAKNKTELERMESKEKTGVRLEGVSAINPFNGQELPLFVADYVLAHYGTGAIMAVPAHDERDWEFAKKYDLPIKQSIASYHLASGNQPDAVRENEKTVERNLVYAVVKHWDEDKYLCLDWKNQKHWTSMVVGGVEKNETLSEAGRREILEETGYKNFKFIKEIELSEIHSYFYAHHKNENRYAKAKGVYVELLNGEKDEIVESEKNIHAIVWVKKDKVREFLAFSNWKLLWDIFLGKVKATVEDGILVNSGEYSGLKSQEAREKMAEWLEKENLGRRQINYKIRDWLVSRQRYWGAPIPIIYCEKCGVVPVPEKDLPVKLPTDVDFMPTGESPLAKSKSFHKIKCPKCGGVARRESDTMDTFVCSSWYYLRYADVQNKKEFAGAEMLKKWLPVDLYLGGAEHTVLHLLYARFFTKVLHNLGYLDFDEPFLKLRHQGIILAEDGRKMSKSLGNVVNPDEVVKRHGADALRLFEMFMGPLEDMKPWNTKGIIGQVRFLEKIWNLFYDKKFMDCGGGCEGVPEGLPRLLHKTIKKVSQDIESLRFNTAISQLMIFINFASKVEVMPRAAAKKFLVLLSPFAPHLAEELWSELGHEQSIFKEEWPEYDENMVKNETINLVIQINGKVRDMIEVLAEISEEEAKRLALENEKIKKWLKGKEVVKIIFVKGRLVNIVIR